MRKLIAYIIAIPLSSWMVTVYVGAGIVFTFPDMADYQKTISTSLFIVFGCIAYYYIYQGEMWQEKVADLFRVSALLIVLAPIYIVFITSNNEILPEGVNLGQLYLMPIIGSFLLMIPASFLIIAANRYEKRALKPEKFD